MKKNKMIIFYVLGAILFFAAVEARSHDHHHTLSTNTESLSTNSTSLALAALQIHADWSTKKVQLGVGVSTFKDDNAVAVGLGRRFGKVLINGSITTNGNDTGYGAGINLRF